LKSCCILQYHYDDERDTIVFHNATQNLQDQDQDQSVQDQDQDRFVWSQTGLVLRLTVSDHITGRKPQIGRKEAHDTGDL